MTLPKHLLRLRSRLASLLISLWAATSTEFLIAKGESPSGGRADD
jgi:hypothetical protein